MNNQYATLETAVQYARIDYLLARDTGSIDLEATRIAWCNAKKELDSYCTAINASNRGSK